MRKCECGNEMGETRGNVTVVIRPCQCKAPGCERSPKPRIGLPSFISKAHYNERKRIGAPMVLPAERGLL